MLKDVESCAAALYAGEWRANDIDEMVDIIGLTYDEAYAICEKMAEYEN